MKTAIPTLLAFIGLFTGYTSAADKTVPVVVETPVFTAPVYVTDTTQALKIKALELQVQLLTSELEMTKERLKFSQLEVKTSPDTQAKLERYAAAVEAWQKSFIKLEEKYKLLVERWNAQQAEIAQWNAAPSPTLAPVFRGKTDAQKAQESLEGIEFQLQQIQVQKMGQEDRAKYGY